jgi:hypothetical protein
MQMRRVLPWEQFCRCKSKLPFDQGFLLFSMKVG